jgi:hypothetical protein
LIQSGLLSFGVDLDVVVEVHELVDFFVEDGDLGFVFEHLCEVAVAEQGLVLLVFGLPEMVEGLDFEEVGVVGC